MSTFIGGDHLDSLGDDMASESHENVVTTDHAIADMATALGTTPEQLQAALAQPMLPGGHLETLMRVQARARKVFGPETGNRRERRAAKAQRGRR